jgi:DNA-binding transcriptional ArsR family regulator
VCAQMARLVDGRCRTTRWTGRSRCSGCLPTARGSGSWALIGRGLSVNELAAQVGKLPAAVSQHLATLRMSGLCQTRREGTRSSTGRPTSTSPNSSPTPSTTPSTPAPGCRATASPTPTRCACTATPRAPDGGRRHDHLEHPHDDGHGHEHPRGLRGRLTALLRPPSHDAADSVDPALESSAQGIRAVEVSLLALAVTAALQGAGGGRQWIGRAAGRHRPQRR